jgi:hypothetical protein
MSTIDKIMALHDEAADAKAETIRLDYETWHRRFKRDAVHQKADDAHEALRACIEQALTPGAGDGYVLVPVKPTEEMIYAAQVAGHPGDGFDVVDDYKAMLAAAPQPRREWVGLTPDERDALVQRADALLDHIYEYGTASEGIRPRLKSLFTAVEAKLREKNGGGV